MPATPFVVEDGTGLEDANSLLGLEEARDHHLLMQNEEFLQADDDRRKAALVAGTAFLDRYRFKGRLLRFDQARPFPRVGLHDREGRHIAGVPRLVKDAVAELSLYALAGQLVPKPMTAASAAAAPERQLSSLAAGSVRLDWEDPETEHGAAGPASEDPVRRIERMLAPLLEGGSGRHSFLVSR